MATTGQIRPEGQHGNRNCVDERIARLGRQGSECRNRDATATGSKLSQDHRNCDKRTRWHDNG